jgi:AcrR family transcriptional regulator
MAALTGSNDLPAWFLPVAADESRRRPALDRDSIVAAAIRIIDAEGLERFSMRRLALELGTGAMSLYRYVQDKDELLDLALDRVMGEIEPPSTDMPWQEALALMARSIRELFHRHPNFVLIRSSRPALGPHILDLLERAFEILRAGGFAGRELFFAASAIWNFSLGFTVFEILPRLHLEAEGRDIDEYSRCFLDYISALPQDRYPNLRELAPVAVGDEDQEFAFGLATVIRGIEQQRRP